MKKLITIFLLPLLILGACKKDLTDVNVDPKSPLTYPSGAFFTGAQKNMSDLLQSTNVNTNIFKLVVQYWTETTYTDESNFDLGTRQIPRQMWNAIYRDVIRDLREAKTLIPEETLSPVPAEDAMLKQNQLAIAEIMEVYAWYYLVTTFGNVPYTESMDAENTQPKYDDQETIYMDLLSRLDAAIAQLDVTGESFGSADLVYGGDVEAWQKFANSFKLKMGMTIADVNATTAQQTVEEAVAAGVFTSNADNAELPYLGAPPNTNPLWVDLVQSGRKDFVVTNTLVNRLQTLNDPRLPVFATTDNTGTGYSGGIPGASNNYATYSKQGDAFIDPTLPGMLLSYDEVEFYLAEAVERGYNVPGTAKEHYDKAVTASINYWGETVGNYLTQPGVAYSSANWEQLIGVQKWIALYSRGWDAWIEWRRLDYPMLVKPPTALSDIPLRFTYPVPEQNLNRANYDEASQAIGTDAVSTRLFWDIN